MLKLIEPELFDKVILKGEKGYCADYGLTDIVFKRKKDAVAFIKKVKSIDTKQLLNPKLYRILDSTDYSYAVKVNPIISGDQYCQGYRVEKEVI